ncbi:hypothetical protein ACVW0Z_000668 [Ewingella americana]
MKRIIKGDTNLSHLVVAHAAIDSHEKAYGTRRQGWPSTYLIKYKDSRVAVEVVYPPAILRCYPNDWSQKSHQTLCRRCLSKVLSRMLQ